MKKRISAAILSIVLLVLCLSGCGNKDYGSPLRINSVSLDGEIFSYYLDKSYDRYIDRDSRITAATESCIRYCAINSMFERYGLSLTADEKATATEESDTLWNMFRAYYGTIGITKATFVKIHIAEKYTEKLRSAIFGKGGTQEIEDIYLRGALLQNFTAYRTITVPMYTKDVYGNRIEFSDEERAALEKVMTDGAAKINNGQNVESVAMTISVSYPMTEYSYDTIVSGPDDHSTTREFLDAVKNMEEGTAAVLEMGDDIYIVRRVAILSDSGILENNRDECLKLLSDEPLNSLIQEECNTYSAVRNTDAAEGYYKIIEKIHS